MLPDILKPDLTVVFVGTAKSTMSAQAGHYYANPTNMFWNLLQVTGLTRNEWLTPSQDSEVLDYGIGLTDLVPRKAASSDALLRASDLDIEAFVDKIALVTPRVVAFNGEKAATKVARYLGHSSPMEGPAAWRIGESLVYRLPSSSSANATGGYTAKREKWALFGRWVAQQSDSQRRTDRAN